MLRTEPVNDNCRRKRTVCFAGFPVPFIIIFSPWIKQDHAVTTSVIAGGSENSITTVKPNVWYLRPRGQGPVERHQGRHWFFQRSLLRMVVTIDALANGLENESDSRAKPGSIATSAVEKELKFMQRWCPNRELGNINSFVYSQSTVETHPS
ncbi:hypothetical protein CY34DRAFT_813555 [Suillus luteus UH-Slu-Lm8-n1]|uniref:Unplaced genomic scaffold CY34scaffold_796, whole genome shotgun sequence n=1 Tax=Suillus luteus UH-Slu-Lm8-n1 TaxID=930992 RepID=A0A0D0AH16_9AGAM|nr:hypothetical protein CY34DRAFT_813555 [Suillus luteus UH-Slu-Lm8-n1]